MPTQETFDSPGSTTWTVPANVTRILVETWGAQGGDAVVGTSGSGGLGGKAQGVIDVTPGEDLELNVGAAGGDSSPSNTAGGGEASDVRQSGTTLSDRILVGGGGGGAADGERTQSGVNGGDGGPGTGQAGDDSGDPVGSSGQNLDGGPGGTQSAGGDNPLGGAGDGSFGTGGSGDTGDAVPGAGDGGDGYYGGAGGAQSTDDSFSEDYASAGGGGSNFITASASDASSTRGVQSGDGQVRLTYAEEPSVTIDSLTETGETDVRVQASNANTSDSSGEWRVYRNGNLVETDTSDTALDYTDTSAVPGQSNTYRVDRVNTYGSDTASQDIKVRLETVTGLAITTADSDEVGVSWDAVANADTYEVLRSGTSGAAYGDYTQIGTTTSPSYSDTSVTSGTTYYYTVRARIDGDTAFDSRYPGEVSATANLLPPVIQSTTADSQTAITVTWSLQDTNPNGDVDVLVDSSVVATVAIGTTSYQATGFSEGTSHDFEIRRDTGSATATSSTSTQYSQPAAPSGLTVESIDGDDITASWTDNSSAEAGYRRLDSTDGGSNFGETGSDLAADTTEATWAGLSRPDTHTLKVRAFVGSGSSEATADSNSVDRYLAPSRSSTNGATWLIEIEHSNGSVLRFRPTDAEFTPKLNALPRFSATVDYDERWLSSGFDDAPLRVWKNGRRLPIDTLTNRPTSPGETTLKGRGGSQLLRQANRSIDQQAVHQAGEDLVTDRTDYVANFDDPTASTTTNTLLQTADTQSEFQQIVGDFPEDLPLYYPLGSSGLIRVAQTCFLGLVDGGDDGPIGSFDTESAEGEGWEDNDIIELNSQGDYVEWRFNVNHVIPSENVGAALRREYNSNDSSGDLAPMRFELNGIELFDLDIGGDIPDIDWGTNWGSNFDSNNGFDLRPENNPHTLRLEIDGAVAANAYYRVDVGALYDDRYHDVSNFPNTTVFDTDNQGWLAGPAKYPDEISFTTQDALPPISAAGARLDLDIGGTYAAKKIELSGDQGSTFPLSATDTETLEGDFSSPVGQIRARITLGAQGTGQFETPTDGYASPELLAFNLYADLDDTPLFIAESFQNSVLNVLIDGADYADSVFEVQWDDEAQSQSVEWTQPGQRTDISTTPISDFDFDRSTEDRRDQIRVVGRSVPVRDEPVTADLGTEQQLAESPIVTDSETVESSTTTFSQGQDYVIDWENGTITTLSSGNISDGESLVVSYDWNPVGEATRAGATQPFTVTEIALPALSTDRECVVAARKIRDATDQPLEEAEVILPPDAIGLEAIDELQFTGLPTDGTLEVNDISDRAGSQVARVGTRESLQDFRDDLERRLSSTAKYS